jgi:hypothetical protein
MLEKGEEMVGVGVGEGGVSMQDRWRKREGEKGEGKKERR